MLGKDTESKSCLILALKGEWEDPGQKRGERTFQAAGGVCSQALWTSSPCSGTERNPVWVEHTSYESQSLKMRLTKVKLFF